MPLLFTTRLSALQREEIRGLVSACKEREGLTLSFPLDERALFGLYYENRPKETGEEDLQTLKKRKRETPRLLCACAFLKETPTKVECSAFTHPDYRKRGLFTTVLKNAKNRISRPDPKKRAAAAPAAPLSFTAYLDGRSEGAIAAAEKLGAENISEEYMLELSELPKPASSEELTVTKGTDPDTGSPLLTYRGFHGELSVLVYPSFYYLYGVTVDTAFQGQGFGTKLLAAVLADLALRSPLPVRLQVSGDNDAALALYKKTGFRITETLSCVLFS